MKHNESEFYGRVYYVRDGSSMSILTQLKGHSKHYFLNSFEQIYSRGTPLHKYLI